MFLGFKILLVHTWALFTIVYSNVFKTGEIIEFNEPSYCAVDEYFNVNQLKCITCDSDKNLVPSVDGLSCVCNERSRIKKWNFASFPVCEPCKENEIPTRDQLDCILYPLDLTNNSSDGEGFQCPSRTVLASEARRRATRNEYEIQNTHCEGRIWGAFDSGKCPLGFPLASNGKPFRGFRKLLERSANGSVNRKLNCVKCEPGKEPSSDQLTCSPCKEVLASGRRNKCSCHEGEAQVDGICFRDVQKNWVEDKTTYAITYDNGKQVDSRFLRENLLRGIFFCKMGNNTACHLVTNMCAMVMYSDVRLSGPCSLFRDRKRIPTSNTDSIPWLYYGEGDAPAVLSRKKISAKFNLNPNSHLSFLNLTGIIYHPDGNLKEIKKITGHDLQLCPASWNSLDASFRFATKYFYTCRIPAKQLLAGRETEFLDLYLSYREDNRVLLYALPILVHNIKHEGSHKNKESDRMQWQLVRRTFLLDKVSGLSFEEDQGWRVDKYPEVVRYAKSVVLNVKLQGREDEGKIFVPYFAIEFGEMTREDIEKNVLVPLSFRVDYQMDNSLSHALEVCMGVFSGLAVVWSGIRTWSNSKRSGRLTIDFVTIAQLMLFTCGNLANVFFLVVFCASLHFFVFFKGESAVHVLLPTAYQEEIIKLYLVFAFFLKVVDVAQIIYNQITIDIFFIDWERPRARNLIPRKSGVRNPESEEEQQPVSIWRTYFVANEWNEIQTKRKINVNIHLLVTVFFLKVVGLEFWSTSDPELYQKLPPQSTGKEFSFICRFTVGTVVYISTYIIQRLWFAFIYERFIKNGIQQFVDLCSMANISVFILAFENYGYYIHGRSAHGFADTDMQNIINQLLREEEDLVGHRGLLPGTDQQTFEMTVPPQLRGYYRKVMAPLKNISQISKRITISTVSGRSKMGSDNIDRSIQAYHNVNRFLAAFLEHALKDLDYEVRDKLFTETLLGIEFTDTSEKGVFYSDNGHSFDSVLLYGNEFSLFTFDVMLFSFAIVLFEDYLIAVILTAAFAYIVTLIKDTGGRKNLAKKTLIDERFLI